MLGSEFCVWCVVVLCVDFSLVLGSFYSGGAAIYKRRIMYIMYSLWCRWGVFSFFFCGFLIVF